ncbi:MAG: DUF1330 domain-containing protein [Gemmatimonadaceae bacterium]
MAKAYWIVCYRSITNPAALAEYAKVAGAAIAAAGGRALARGTAARVYEGGIQLRTVVIEFESVEHAIAAYESPAYQSAAALLRGSAERDFRILEAVE